MRKGWIAAAAVGAALGSFGASATVRYDFELKGLLTLVYDSPDFITASRSVPLGDVTSCTTTFGTCEAVNFIIGYTGFPNEIDGDDVLQITNSPQFDTDGAFAAGTFGKTGTFATFDGIEKLTITDLGSLPTGPGTVGGSGGGSSSDVPEPAAWAMMLGGLALVGAAMRRRRVGGLRPAI